MDKRPMGPGMSPATWTASRRTSKTTDHETAAAISDCGLHPLVAAFCNRSVPYPQAYTVLHGIGFEASRI